MICQYSCDESGANCGQWDGKACRTSLISVGLEGTIGLFNESLNLTATHEEVRLNSTRQTDKCHALWGAVSWVDAAGATHPKQNQTYPQSSLCQLLYKVPGSATEATFNRTKKQVRKYFNEYQCEEAWTFNGMASLSFTGQENTIHGMFHTYTNDNVFLYTTAECLVYLSVYFVLAVWTYGIQVPSGLFVPGIISGCAFGRLTGEFVRAHICESGLKDEWTGVGPDRLEALGGHPIQCTDTSIHPGTYALIGAAAMLGGMTRMTISLCIILLETTNDIQYLLPIMLVLIASKSVGDRFNISLYDMHVEVKCIPFLEHRPPAGMEQLHAADLMSKPVTTPHQRDDATPV